MKKGVWCVIASCTRGKGVGGWDQRDVSEIGEVEEEKEEGDLDPTVWERGCCGFVSKE